MHFAYRAEHISRHPAVKLQHFVKIEKNKNEKVLT